MLRSEQDDSYKHKLNNMCWPTKLQCITIYCTSRSLYVLIFSQGLVAPAWVMILIYRQLHPLISYVLSPTFLYLQTHCRTGLLLLTRLLERRYSVRDINKRDFAFHETCNKMHADIQQR